VARPDRENFGAHRAPSTRGYRRTRNVAEEVRVTHGSVPSPDPPPFVGEWVKVAGDPGTEIYPDHLHFDVGTYRGRRGDDQTGMLWWDAGIYRVEHEGRLILSTANDELVTYRVRLDRDTLHIVDPDGRSLAYRRS